MQEFRVKSQKYRSSHREVMHESDNSTSPELRIKRFSESRNHLLNSVNSESAISKLLLKQELTTLKTLPNLEYKPRLQSLLTMISNSPSTSSSLQSPRWGDFSSQQSEKESVQSNNRNVQLKPLFSINNCVSRAGYKIHNGSSNRSKKYRQVGVIIKPSFQNTKGKYLFSLIEGHGPEGYKLVDHFQSNLVNVLEMHVHLDSEMVLSSIKNSDEFLINSLQESRINLGFSGCSVINVLVYGNEIFLSNIGTCQAVLGNFTDRWAFRVLNKAHDLKNSKERQRILDFGGKIHKIENNANPELSYEKFDSNGHNSPKFEKTRTIGDLTGKIIGICSKPDAFKFQISPEDKFVIIGNSALWKAIEPDEAVQMVVDGWTNKKTDICCNLLVKEAKSRIERRIDENDDICAIVFFMN